MASPAALRPMIASSSRLTLLHPCHLPKRILRSPLASRFASSVAQQRPVESAAFADVHAPPYISPVDKVKADTLGKGDVKLDKGKAKAVDELGHAEGSDLGTKVQTTEPAPKRRSIRASKSAITMVSLCPGVVEVGQQRCTSLQWRSPQSGHNGLASPDGEHNVVPCWIIWKTCLP